jgi:hypothetical protein
MSTAELNITTLCGDISQQIIDKCDFMDIEKNVQELCILFQNKWKYFTNIECDFEQYKSYKTEFVDDSNLVFSTLYKHYGCEEALKEMNECLQEEPDAQPDVDEYLHFVENLNVARNMTESDFDEPDSKMSRTLIEAMLYIQKKTEEMNALSNTMKQMTLTLEKLQPVLESMIIPVAVPVLDSTTNNNDDE